MKALLLAAGRATRLGALSRTTPKCLHEVAGEILLDRLVGQLEQVGVEQFLINTHHLAPRVREHVAAAPWGERAVLTEEPELLGTLGTLRASSWFWGEEPGWVLHADNFISGTLQPTLSRFRERPSGVWGAMLTFAVEDPSCYGVVETDADGVVTSFVEKDPYAASRWASAATFLLDPRARALAENLPASATDISRDLLPRLTGRLVTVRHAERVVDVGTPAGLAEARRLAASSPVV